MKKVRNDLLGLPPELDLASGCDTSNGDFVAMKTPPASAHYKVVSWKQLSTIALAGCTAAGIAAPAAWPVPRFAVLPATRTHYPGEVWTGAHFQVADFGEPRPFVFQRDFVLGTSFDLVVWAMHKRHAEFVETVVLREIDRLCPIFNVYDPQSEVSRLNRNASIDDASPDLLALLGAYETWSALTGGVVSAQLGSLLELWQTAEANHRLPPGNELAAAAEALRLPGWHIEAPARRVSRHGSQWLNLNSLGKGYIIRQAMSRAQALCGDVFGVLLNIGGDISTWGSGAAQPGSPWRIFCADPAHPQENATPLTALNLADRAVATSAGYERGYTIAGQRFSHIIDPRTGWPAHGVASATVIANDSLMANAVATALCVLQPAEGLSLVRMVQDVEALIVAADGALFRSPGFGSFESPLTQVAPGPGATPPVSPPAIAPVTAPGSGADPQAPTPIPAADSISTTSAPATNNPVAASAPAPLPPLTVGQSVILTSNDPISFTRGISHIKRPVRSDEIFSVTAIAGDDVTIADRFANQATVSRSILTLFTPAPVAAAPPPVTPPSSPSTPLSVPASANAAPSAAADNANWPSGYQVTLSIDLPTPTTPAGKVKRPYVIWWIEDSNGKPIHTVSLWGNKIGHVKEMTEWWREVGSSHPIPWVQQTTRATRQPGKYQIVWDGKDDTGKSVSKGNYIMVLEVAREDAGHDIVRTPIICQDAPVQGTIPGGREFLDTPYTYGPGS